MYSYSPGKMGPHLQYETKPLSQLLPYEFRQCYLTNYGNAGEMRGELMWQRKTRASTARAYMAWDGKTLAGWALGFYSSQGGWTVYTYVKYAYRRKGIGTELLRRAKRKPGTILVCPHTPEAKKFYRTVGLKAGGKLLSAYEHSP